MNGCIALQVVKRAGPASQWWRTPLIPALGRQRQEDLYEFKSSLVYKAVPGQLGLLHREILSQKIKTKQINK